MWNNHFDKITENSLVNTVADSKYLVFCFQCSNEMCMKIHKRIKTGNISKKETSRLTLH